MEVDFDLAINYSPRRCFFSAPTSPSRVSEFYDSPPSAIPFHWEQTPGTPKSPGPGSDFDFAFDVSLESHKNSASAEELFDCGKIRPLKPPPRLHFTGLDDKKQSAEDRLRGRNRQDSNWRHRVTRSLSPFRFSHFQQQEQQPEEEQNVKPSSSFSWSTKGFSKKWSFKNFLLFRSASEGRADPLRKYTPLTKKHEENVNNSSFRSTDTSDSMRKGSSRDLRRKTSLLGPMLHHALGNGSASFGR